MALEEYQIEQERRVNTLVSEIAVIRETVRFTTNTLDEIKKSQQEISAAVAKGNAFNDRIELTLKYNIDAQIDNKLIPVHQELAERKEEAIIRKTQIAMWAMFGGGIGTVLAAVLGYILKVWGH